MALDHWSRARAKTAVYRRFEIRDFFHVNAHPPATSRVPTAHVFPPRSFDVFNSASTLCSSFRTHAHEPPRRVRHPHPAQPRTCASPRPAPRASRPSSAPRATSTPPRPRSPSSRRRNASTPPNTMRGACAPDTPLRHANATPTNATRATPPAGTREPHHARPPPPTAPRSSLSRRRAAPFPARASADGSCFSAPRNNRSRPRRAPETARARAVATARAPRGRFRHSNVRGDATRARRRARVRAPPPLRHDARPPTRRHDTSLTHAPLFHRACTFSPNPQKTR